MTVSLTDTQRVRVSTQFRVEIPPTPNLDLGNEVREIGEAGAVVRAPFVAVLSSKQLRIHLWIDVVDRQPTCTRYMVERADGAGLESVTLEVLRGLPLRPMVALACAAAAYEPDSSGGIRLRQGVVDPALLGSIIQAGKRTRRPISEERLREFSDAFRAEFVPGRMAEFAASFGCSERQAYRLRKLAKERGLLDDEGTK